MIEIKPILIIFIILFSYSCQSNIIDVNAEADKNKIDSIINTFYALDSVKNYEKMFELFTLGNSKLSREELNIQLREILNATTKKSGEVKTILSKKYNTKVITNSIDTIGLYEATIDIDRTLFSTRETFKMMLEKNNIKIYDYHIATKSK